MTGWIWVINALWILAGLLGNTDQGNSLRQTQQGNYVCFVNGSASQDTTACGQLHTQVVSKRK